MTNGNVICSALRMSILVLFSSTASAAVFVDEFNAPHDYSTGDVAGTGWDGVLFPENAATFNAGVTNAGRLTIGVPGASGLGAGYDFSFGGRGNTQNGPFLYQLLSGPFDAQTQVAATSDGRYAVAALMAKQPEADERVPLLRNHVSWLYSAWINASGVRNVLAGEGYPESDIEEPGLPSFFRMTRGELGAGNEDEFRFYWKVQAGDPWTFRYATTLAYAHNQPLQVGLWFGGFADGAFHYGAFERYSLTTIPEPASALMVVVAAAWLGRRRLTAAARRGESV
jgi:hypothetical protein